MNDLWFGFLKYLVVCFPVQISSGYMLGVPAVCMCVCTHCMQIQMHMVTVMLFMALAVSWKGTTVSRVSMQTLFIIIIIIVINHSSSGVPGSNNALNHWPGCTWILYLKWERRKTRIDCFNRKRLGEMERKKIGGQRSYTRKRSC